MRQKNLDETDAANDDQTYAVVLTADTRNPLLPDDTRVIDGLSEDGADILAENLRGRFKRYFENHPFAISVDPDDGVASLYTPVGDAVKPNAPDHATEAFNEALGVLVP
jgi:hypothetical protein